MPRSAEEMTGAQEEGIETELSSLAALARESLGQKKFEKAVVTGRGWSVEEAVEHCLVHNTLLHSPKIELKVAGAIAAK